MFYDLTKLMSSPPQSPLKHEPKTNMIDLKCHYFFYFVTIFTHSCAPAISLGQKMARNIVMQNNSCSQEGEVKCTRGPSFFSFRFLLFLFCSHEVLTEFPMGFAICSQELLTLSHIL